MTVSLLFVCVVPFERQGCLSLKILENKISTVLALVDVWPQGLDLGNQMVSSLSLSAATSLFVALNCCSCPRQTFGLDQKCCRLFPAMTRELQQARGCSP